MWEQGERLRLLEERVKLMEQEHDEKVNKKEDKKEEEHVRPEEKKPRRGLNCRHRKFTCKTNPNLPISPSWKLMR